MLRRSPAFTAAAVFSPAGCGAQLRLVGATVRRDRTWGAAVDLPGVISHRFDQCFSERRGQRFPPHDTVIHQESQFPVTLALHDGKPFADRVPPEQRDRLVGYRRGCLFSHS